MDQKYLNYFKYNTIKNRFPLGIINKEVNLVIGPTVQNGIPDSLKQKFNARFMVIDNIFYKKNRQ